MSVVSFLLGVLSLLLAIASIPLAAIPYAGVICSVLSVFSAVGGIVTGAKANSKARENGEDTTFAVIAIVLNSIMFLGGLCITLTCGACNVLWTKANREGFRVRLPDGGTVYMHPGDPIDGGVFDPWHYAPPPPPPYQAPPPVAPDDVDAALAPSAPTPQGAPPPAMPPPPMDPAPGH